MSIEERLRTTIDIKKTQARDIMFSKEHVIHLDNVEIHLHNVSTILQTFKEENTQFLLCYNKDLSGESNLGVCSLQHICEQIIENKEIIHLVDHRISLKFFAENQTFMEILQVINNISTPIGVVVDRIGELCGVISQKSVIHCLSNFNIGGSESIQRFVNIIPKNILHSVKSETIGGFIMEYLDKIPREGDSFILNNYQFTIIEMSKNTIQSIALNAIDKEVLYEKGN